MQTKLKSYLDQALKVVLGSLMVLLVLDVLWQVFSRFILKNPSSFTDELARYLMIWVALFGAAFVTGRKAHVAIDLLSDRGGKGLQYLVIMLVMVFLVLVMIIGGGRLVMLSFQLEQQSSAMNWPIGYVYLALPLSGLTSLLYLSCELSALLRSKSDKSIHSETNIS